MFNNKLKVTVFVVGLIGLPFFLFLKNAQAIPSFERQTGLSCNSCHTVFPELTPFGRHFKLTGYVIDDGKKHGFPPVAALAQASFTDAKGLHNGIAPFDDPEDSVNDKFNLPQELSIYYGGKIINRIGAFIQLTYDGTGNDIALDMTDIRYANIADLGGTKLIYGITINNSPSLEDVWNSTAAFGFPYAASSVAPTPAAGAIIDGGLDQQVGGIGAYVFWNNLFYGDISVYRTARNGITRPLSAGNDIETVVDDVATYWRLALQHQIGKHSLSVGTSGIIARIFPEGMTSGPTDKFTDTTVDGQYQFISKKHIFSVQSTWIHESQDRDASHALGDSSNMSDSLNTFKINANYFYRDYFGSIGGSLGYFSITGDRDALLYSPDPVDGSRTGKPNSNGFIIEADYLPWENTKFSVQYTIYDKFNGTHNNYDGSGRDASDNNTLYLLAWFMI
jgi:hypothetical protein